MKLLRLKITDENNFRSLQPGFEVYFLKEWDFEEANDFNPYIFAGPNGSGKSNVLEALASIFYHIECIYLDNKPDSFEFDEENNQKGFRSEVASPDGFELEYLTRVPSMLNLTGSQNLAHIFIEKENGKVPVVKWMNRIVFDEESNINLSRIEIKDVLPEFILGYSSGENEILSLPFFKMRFIHFDEYTEFLKRQYPYSKPEGRLMFLNNEFNQAIVLSNILLQDISLLSPYKEEVGVEDIKQFRIIIKKYIQLDKHETTEDPQDTIRYFKSMTETIEDEFGEEKYRIDITQNLKSIIDKLISCSTCSYYDSESDEWYLDYWVNDETKKAFSHNFESAIDLFQVFQILLTLNLFTVDEKLKKELYQSSSLYVNETIPVLPSDHRIMRFKDLWLQKSGVSELVLSKALSDGEHQFLHTLGLCLLYRDRRCLFLLDEPETHFNPDWRAKFIARIRDCFDSENSKRGMSDMLITTHTPYLISDSKPEYVLEFSKSSESKIVNVKRPDYNTLGASINQITTKTFEKRETIGEYAEAILKDMDRRFDTGINHQELLEEAENRLGDSVEKLLFINKIMNSMEGE